MTLCLIWKDIDVREEQDMLNVEVTVTLRSGDLLLYWRFKVTNRSRRYGIERVRFPNPSLTSIGEGHDDVFIYRLLRGGLARDPFGVPSGFGTHLNTSGTYYTHNFNMQFQALYDELTGTEFFWARAIRRPVA